MALYFFYAFLAAGLLNFICSVLLLRGLAEAGINVSFFEIRWQVHKHMKTYRKVTTETTGKVAWPYYGYQASLLAMIGFGLLALYSLGQ
jgi:hypothetical protein